MTTDAPSQPRLLQRRPLDPRVRSRRLLRGANEDAAWVRPSLLALLAATAVLYLWRLGDSGYANSFYSAAVQAGSTSWKAFFFGSFDSSNFITVDKPPASLWVMELSARVFGVSSWSILVPQALEGVAAVALLYATVRRCAGPAAGLIAGATLALTPVAVLMFRFNNPDALLTLLLVASAYALVHAIERADSRWLILCSALVGTAFLTKMLQAFTVVPVFALVYLLAAPTPLRRRLLQLGSAALVLVVSSGWWVAIVELTPASDRPYIGGSQDNSLPSLIFGYNGFGRLTGNESGSVGGGAGGGRWGATGWDRLFSNQMGTQISWLIPAALMLSCYLIWHRRRQPRTDLTRAATMIFVGWLVVTGLVFSYAQGIIHPYYTVVLAPAIGALVGLGAVSTWHSRDRLEARVVAAAATAATAIWAYVLLGRTPDFYPQLRLAVVAVGILAAVSLLALDRLGGRLAASVAVAALATTIASPTAYALSTASTPHEGAIPSAGPSGASLAGPGGLPQAFGQGQAPPPGFGGQGGQFQPPGQGGLGGQAGQGPPGVGGLLGASTPTKALTQLLRTDSAHYRWVAAVAGANAAAGYQLATGQPVMAIGGFNGTDPTPTLAQFKAYVRQGKIHYFISSGGGPGIAAGSSAASRISTWVSANYQSTTVGNVTLYNLG